MSINIVPMWSWREDGVNPCEEMCEASWDAVQFLEQEGGSALVHVFRNGSEIASLCPETTPLVLVGLDPDYMYDVYLWGAVGPSGSFCGADLMDDEIGYTIALSKWTSELIEFVKTRMPCE